MIIRERAQWQESNVSLILGLFDRRVHILTVPLILTLIALSSTINQWWDPLTLVVVRPSCCRARISPFGLIVIVEARHAAALTFSSTLVIVGVALMPATTFALNAESAAAAPLVFVLRARTVCGR